MNRNNMEYKIHLNSKSEKIIKDTLQIDDLKDVLNKEYKRSEGKDTEIRKKFNIFSNRIRGSVRLGRGQFYTNDEFDERVKQSMEVELP